MSSSLIEANGNTNTQKQSLYLKLEYKLQMPCRYDYLSTKHLLMSGLMGSWLFYPKLWNGVSPCA